MSSDPPEGDGTVLFRAFPPERRFSQHEKQAVAAFARTLACQVTSGRAFTCLITRDRELQNLNRMFLAKDCPTDVLSFPARDGSTLGEIAISVDRAEAQAMENGHSRIDEVRILMLHGVLHLIGMDHARDRGAMARAERRWRSKFHLPATLIMRASGSTLLQ
ncbi:MAG: rRNA maturation RNase YbeY [Acidobacteriaceae bacterium]|nr:rRNA maturation RNase YbeY [Acidobacteriaceae bacterium]MBV9778922.1 rRNA maturation RNase YbeY [Acidobacteriaceae bacterium]